MLISSLAFTISNSGGLSDRYSFCKVLDDCNLIMRGKVRGSAILNLDGDMKYVHLLNEGKFQSELNQTTGRQT